MCLCVLCGSQNIQRLFPYTALIYKRDGGCSLRGTDWVFVCKSQYLSNFASVVKVGVCNVLPLLQPGTVAAQHDTGSVSQRSLTAHTTGTAEPQLAADIVRLNDAGNKRQFLSFKRHVSYACLSESPVTTVNHTSVACSGKATVIVRDSCIS